MKEKKPKATTKGAANAGSKRSAPKKETTSSKPQPPDAPAENAAPVPAKEALPEDNQTTTEPKASATDSTLAAPSAPQETITDPVLGELTFARALWLGTVEFKPIGRKVEIQILALASKGELTDAQREFFREGEKRYGDLLEQVRQELLRRYPHFGESFTTEEMGKQFTLQRLDIIHTPDGMTLVLFYKRSDEGPALSFGFKDWNLLKEKAA